MKQRVLLLQLRGAEGLGTGRQFYFISFGGGVKGGGGGGLVSYPDPKCT